MNPIFEPEDKAPLSKLRKTQPSLRDVSLRTLLRWCQRGARGVLMESVLVGGRVMSSAGAVERFLAVLNQTPASGSSSAPRSPHQRRTASEAAARELTAAGA